MIKACTSAISGWRMSCWLCISAVLLAAIAHLAPAQLPVLVNKCLQVTLAAYGGYWLHRSVCPYARPSEILLQIDHMNTSGKAPNDWELLLGRLAATTILARAILMSAVIIAVALGL